MRCPACSVENAAEAAKCTACGEKLSKPARRKQRNFDDKYSLIASRIPRNRAAVQAYRCALYGLIPGVGLLLGGAAIVYGIVGRRRFHEDPELRGLGHAIAGIVLGTLELLSNGIGLAFIWVGLQSLGQ
jgi:hypothetical protein